MGGHRKAAFHKSNCDRFVSFLRASTCRAPSCVEGSNWLPRGRRLHWSMGPADASPGKLGEGWLGAENGEGTIFLRCP